MTKYNVVNIKHGIIGTVEAKTYIGAKQKWGRKVNEEAGSEGRVLGASYWVMHSLEEVA